MPKAKPPLAVGGAGAVAPKPPLPKPVNGGAAGVEEDVAPNEKPAPEVAGGLAGAGAGVDGAAPPAAPNAKAGGTWEAGAPNLKAAFAGLDSAELPPKEKGGPPVSDANEGTPCNGAAAEGGGALSAGLDNDVLPKANRGLLEDAASSFFFVAAGVVAPNSNGVIPVGAVVGEAPFPAGTGSEGVPPLPKENRGFLLGGSAAPNDDAFAEAGLLSFPTGAGNEAVFPAPKENWAFLPEGSAGSNNGALTGSGELLFSAITGNEEVPLVPEGSVVFLFNDSAAAVSFFSAIDVVPATVPLDDAQKDPCLLTALSDPTRSSFFSSLDAEAAVPKANRPDKFLAVPKLNPPPAASSSRPRFGLAGVLAGVVDGKGGGAAAAKDPEGTPLVPLTAASSRSHLALAGIVPAPVKTPPAFVAAFPKVKLPVTLLSSLPPLLGVLLDAAAGDAPNEKPLTLDFLSP